MRDGRGRGGLRDLVRGLFNGSERGSGRKSGVHLEGGRLRGAKRRGRREGGLILSVFLGRRLEGTERRSSGERMADLERIFLGGIERGSGGKCRRYEWNLEGLVFIRRGFRGKGRRRQIHILVGITNFHGIIATVRARSGSERIGDSEIEVFGWENEIKLERRSIGCAKGCIGGKLMSNLEQRVIFVCIRFGIG